MHAFHEHCRRALEDIRHQGRYRSFTALEKQAERFPVYRRSDGTEVLVWSSNDYLAMGVQSSGHGGGRERGTCDGRRCRRDP